MFESIDPVRVPHTPVQKPVSVFRWPDHFNTEAQHQQLYANNLPTPVNTIRVPRNINRTPSLPKPVTGVHVTRVPQPGNNVRVTVHFNQVPDVAYQSANVFLKQGAGAHTLVGSTSGTSTSFVLPKTGASSVITVQSQGVGTALPLEHSPSKAINLR